MSWVGITMMNTFVMEKHRRRRNRAVHILWKQGMKSRLIWVTYSVTCGHIVPRPVMHPRAMSGSVTLWQLASVLIPMNCVTMKDHMDVHGLSCHQGSHWYPRAML